VEGSIGYRNWFCVLSGASDEGKSMLGEERRRRT
jgi:hypothetical protein